MTTFGTAYFEDMFAAIAYYEFYGFNAQDIADKFAAGEIHVYERPPTKPGDVISLIPGEGRYQITEAAP